MALHLDMQVHFKDCNGDKNMYLQKIEDCKNHVTFELPRKVRLPLLKRLLFSSKGRRKDKDSPVPIPDETKPYLEEDFIRKRIVTSADVHKLVQQPQGVEFEEWLATHTISFFEHVNLLYGAVSEYCTTTGCHSMSAPCNTQFLWYDEKAKKKCKCAAPQYVDYVMTYTHEVINTESVFPTKHGNVFPSLFEEIVKKIHRLLFHVICHIYQSHFKEIVQLDLHGHLNSLFLHFIQFSRTYNILDEKETLLLDDLRQKLEEECDELSAESPSSEKDSESAAAAESDISGSHMDSGCTGQSGGDTPLCGGAVAANAAAAQSEGGSSTAEEIRPPSPLNSTPTTTTTAGSVLLLSSSCNPSDTNTKVATDCGAVVENNGSVIQDASAAKAAAT